MIPEYLGLTTCNRGSAIIHTVYPEMFDFRFHGRKRLPRQSDQSTDSQTTPPAELNPLLNPLLADNMGRWAEAYFTSPPDNREQAVLDLIRQLEAEKAAGKTGTGTRLQT